MGEIRIRDAHSFLNETFRGELIAEADTKGRPPRRWVEIRLYALDDGKFMVHRIGQSMVYHQADTDCQTSTRRQSGDPAKTEDLPDGAQSCDRCEPPYPDELEPGEAIRLEWPRHTIDVVDTPDEVIRRLTTMRQRRGRMNSRIISEPVRDLLTEAARNDERFAEAMDAFTEAAAS